MSWEWPGRRRRAARVFISYRRSETAHVAGRLRDRLVEAFGTKDIFFDVFAIPPGSDFQKEIQAKLKTVVVVVAVIGKDFNPDRQLFREGDFVRQELAEALRQNKVVVPVLVDGAGMPKKEDLPPDLKELPSRTAVTLQPDPHFPDDVKRLLVSLKQILAAEEKHDQDKARPGKEWPRLKRVKARLAELRRRIRAWAHRVLGDGRRRLLIAAVSVAVCALAFFIALAGTLASDHLDGTKLKSDDYLTVLGQGRITTATIVTPDPRITGTYDQGRYRLSIPPGAEGELVSRLRAAGVPLREVRHARAGAVLPLGLAVLALVLVGAGLFAGLPPRRYAGMAARMKARRGALLVLVPLFAVSVGLLAVPVLWMSPSTAGTELQTDEYLSLVSQERIRSATLLEADKRISGTYDRGPYWVTVSLPAVRSLLASEHAKAGLHIEVDEQAGRKLIRRAAYGLSIVVFLLAVSLTGTLTVDSSGHRSGPKRA